MAHSSTFCGNFYGFFARSLLGLAWLLIGPGAVGQLHAAVITFNVVINGAQEVPPNAVAASGSGTATVDTVANTITYSFSVTGLSSMPTGTHFHGPAARGVNTGVKIDISTAPFSGTVNYSEADEADILNGLWYVNYHTSFFPGGEVRGQLDTVTFNVAISGAQEVPPNTVAANGSGTATVNTAANTIAYSFAVTGLTGSLSGAHFHGPAVRGAAAGVKIDIGGSPFSGTVNYNEADQTDILSGMWYVNYHTAAFPGGEVRGQLDNNSNPPRLVNIATRMQVLTGDNVLIGGFIIGGSTPKTIVVRARGPSLTALGVPGALANPVVNLYSGQTVIASNDDWQTASNSAAVQTSGFAPSNAQEAAILITLNPGPYTAIVTGAGGTTGVGLVEVFEVNAFTTPLINIATRGQVLTGDNVMIGGFIIQGSGPQTVVVRARGPSLTALGVPGALANPVLSLYSGQTVIASNDDWQTASNSAALQASGFAPSNAQEAAIFITLNPGAYTAIVSGAGNTTGVGIVEVFAAP